MCEGIPVSDNPSPEVSLARVARGLRIAALVKQVPRTKTMALDSNGRLRREGIELEMNPYCRRAVSKGVELAQLTGGTCTVVTLGPDAAEDCLREAIAWGADAGLLVTDLAFAGSDTLATARALSAALQSEGPFDLVLVGRNSVDADTGQVGPQLAELLDMPFACGVRELELLEGNATDGGNVSVRVTCEHDDGKLSATLDLPAVLSVAERLCEPCKVEPEGRRAVDARTIRRIDAASCGAGPWGQAGSPTSVGEVRVFEVSRLRRQLEGSIDEQVREAVEILRQRGVFDPEAGDGPFAGGMGDLDGLGVPTGLRKQEGGLRVAAVPAVAVMVEPGRELLTRELLGEAAVLAESMGGQVLALVLEDSGETVHSDRWSILGTWGADAVVVFTGSDETESVARSMAEWADETLPWAILAPSTAWGREVASRVAARIGAGLTGDAIALEHEGALEREGAVKHEGSVEHPSGRLIGWKPAFGGQCVAAVTANSAVQMATVRAGVLVARRPRNACDVTVIRRPVVSRGRMQIHGRVRDDDPDALAHAEFVVGVGMGVKPEEYPRLQPLVDSLHAELAATRKVTDRGWLPHSRQIGMTGWSIAPRLYVAVGISGKFTHLVGVRSAGTILAINNDPSAPVFADADIGIVGDWRDVAPKLMGEVLAPSL